MIYAANIAFLFRNTKRNKRKYLCYNSAFQITPLIYNHLHELSTPVI